MRAKGKSWSVTSLNDYPPYTDAIYDIFETKINSNIT